MTKLVNRAEMSTATTGTGTITLGTAVAGFQSFAAAGVVDGDVVRYVIEDGTDFEIGTGTFGSAGGTLTRTLVESSTGVLLNLTGNAVVFVIAAAEDIVQPADNISTLTNDAGYTTNTGTVTSVGLTAGTGISVSGGPVTSSGSIAVTNTAPDQTVVLTQGANVTITGTYPSFTIASTDTNTTYTAGTGLDLTGTTFSIDSTIATLTGTQTLTNKTLTSPDINGGTIDGTVIGGATPAAISGTTGSFSGDVTLADKIVHSGDTNTAIRFPATDTVTVETAGSERLRITSAGNVGIGTSSPAAELDVSGSFFLSGTQRMGGSSGVNIVADTTAVASGLTSLGFSHIGNSRLRLNVDNPNTSGRQGAYLRVGDNQSGHSLEIGVGATPSAQLSAGPFINASNHPILFAINTTERARIDASGNVGIGTSSPSSRLHTVGDTFFDGSYTEKVFAVTGTTPALSPTNGSVQTWTLSGNSTPTAGTWASGQSITILIDDGTAHTITWTTIGVVFKTDGGVAPTLNTSGDTVIALWKVGTTIYGARVGDA